MRAARRTLAVAPLPLLLLDALRSPLRPEIHTAGWLSAFGSFMFYQAHIDDLIAQNQELPKGWDSDGASGLAVMFFGWLISLIYSLPWLIIFMLSVGVRKWGRKLQTD